MITRDDLLNEYREHVENLSKLMRKRGSRKNMERARHELDKATDTVIKMILWQKS